MASDIPPLQVYLLHPSEVISGSPFVAACYDELQAGFALQSATAHRLAPEMAAADFILAPIQGAAYGPHFEALRSHPIYRKHVDRLLAYSTDDNQFPAVRGLYPSLRTSWTYEGWSEPAHYFSTHFHKFRFTADELKSKDLLFSFVGSSQTHPIRKAVVRWQHPDGVIIDSSATGDDEYWWQKMNKDQFLESFRDITLRSSIILCPRGISPATNRIYEAMEAAAVPIIIGDDFPLPRGPKWEEFSVRVPEHEMDGVLDLVEGLTGRMTEMGWRARRAWEEFFSPQALVGSVVDWSRELLAKRVRRPSRLWLEEYGAPGLLRAKLRYHWRGRPGR
jgi:hypothetical protein